MEKVKRAVNKQLDQYIKALKEIQNNKEYVHGYNGRNGMFSIFAEIETCLTGNCQVGAVSHPELKSCNRDFENRLDPEKVIKFLESEKVLFNEKGFDSTDTFKAVMKGFHKRSEQYQNKNPEISLRA